MFSHPSRFLLIFLGCVPAWGDDDTAWSPELSMQVETIGSVTPSPDGAWVAYTRTRAVMEAETSQMVTQIYVAKADGSRRFQLTSGEQSCTSPAFSADSQQVFFFSRRSGEANIWRIALDGGEAQQLTDWEGPMGSFQVSPDGRSLAFLGRKKDVELEQAKQQKLDFQIVGETAKNDHLWLTSADLNLETQEPERISDPAIHVQQFQWSADGSRIVFEHWPRPEPDYWLQSDIAELELANRGVRELAADEASERSPRYSPDGKWVAFVRSSHLKNWAREGRLVILNLESGESRTLPVTQDEFGRGSNLLGFTEDSTQLLFTETQGTRNVLMTMGLTEFAGEEALAKPGTREEGKPTRMGYPHAGTLAGYGRGARLNATGTHIGFARESTAEAVEAYLLDLEGDT